MTRKNDTLHEILCPRCGRIAGEIIHAEPDVRKGWYCTYCKHFEPAILRERVVKKE